MILGESQQLGPALSAVYTKANSVVSFELPAPSWLHRFIIGKQGANIKKVSKYSRLLIIVCSIFSATVNCYNKDTHIIFIKV